MTFKGSGRAGPLRGRLEKSPVVGAAYCAVHNSALYQSSHATFLYQES